MPIQLQIHRPDRMLVGIVSGTVTAEDLDGFVAEIFAAKVEGYRKIIDLMASMSITPEVITAFSERMHGRDLAAHRGPIALVADKEIGPLAELFARLMGDDRPVKVFRSIHAARQWLYANSKI